MSDELDFEESAALVLAAEDCPPETFSKLHKFSRHDESIITSLMAHGPVLLRGSRGSGKSALMIEAANRLRPSTYGFAHGIYVSLRHFKLLRSRGENYEHLLCEMISSKVREAIGERAEDFQPETEAAGLQRSLARLATTTQRRLVLLFDDAAHLGREASLADFFDVFRTLASQAVSCKAAIYPGVTRFGNRFDILNDATVIEVARNEELPGFSAFFKEVMESRYPDAFSDDAFSRSLSRERVAGFLGRAVLGNTRAFVFACNDLKQRCGGATVGLPELGASLIDLAQNYYWPLLDEIRPKLGIYEPMVERAQALAEILLKASADKENSPRDVLIHRDVTVHLAKPLEILEYSGFIAKREASRAMKSGGRGSRFYLNLCNLLEHKSGSRLTSDLLETWSTRGEPVEFHRSGPLSGFDVPVPALDDEREMGILAEPLSSLQRSNAYPYGLTAQKIEVLDEAGFKTVGDLAQASDADLLKIRSIGWVHLQRIRNVIGQAIWM
jgi:hypothetical protein